MFNSFIYLFFASILLLSLRISAQNEPSIDALIYKDNKVFLRISIIKSDDVVNKLTKLGNNDLWDINWQSAENKSFVQFSIKGSVSSLSELEKWLFEKGFSNVSYKGQVIPVSMIEENYVHPESPEKVEFRRNK